MRQAERQRWRISRRGGKGHNDRRIIDSQIARRREKHKLGVGYSPLAGNAAMGQLLLMLIVPPIVGVISYMVIRRIWERDAIGASEAVTRRDPSAATPAEGTSTDLGGM
jgi:hypothetical protein